MKYAKSVRRFLNVIWYKTEMDSEKRLTENVSRKRELYNRVSTTFLLNIAYNIRILWIYKFRLPLRPPNLPILRVDA